MIPVISVAVSRLRQMFLTLSKPCLEQHQGCEQLQLQLLPKEARVNKLPCVVLLVLFVSCLAFIEANVP